MKSITKEKLKSIVDLSESVPDQYRLICFEILLRDHLMVDYKSTKDEEEKKNESETKKTKEDKKNFIIPLDVKAFLGQFGLAEEIICKLFLTEGDEARPIYTIKETKKSKTQIQYSLLMALENALKSGKFQVGIEELRQKCIDQKSYDTINFMTILKTNNKYYKSIEKDQPLILSPEGKSELAD